MMDPNSFTGSDCVSERIYFEKADFQKKSADNKNHDNFPSM